MKLALACIIGALAIPRDVDHVRCLKTIGEDEFIRLEWVTRDGRRDDVVGETCHRVRFRGAKGVEWMAEP